MATKSLKARTEELLLYHLENNDWFDKALYAYTNSLLDIMSKDSRSVRELEALVRLFSKYATYLNPNLCSVDYEWTQEEKMEELTRIKEHLSWKTFQMFPDIPFTASQRIKTLESFMEKIWRKGSTPSKAESDLKDMVAARFILAGRDAREYVNECYLFFDTIVGCLFDEFGFRPIPGVLKATEGFEKSAFDSDAVYVPDEVPEGLRFLHLAKDYIRNPKTNGYQGLQIALYSPQRDLYFEVQVKTLVMFENAEFFESAHDELYKGKDGIAGIDHRLFDGYDFSKLHLHGFHSRDGKKYVDHIGLLVPRSF